MADPARAGTATKAAMRPVNNRAKAILPPDNAEVLKPKVTSRTEIVKKTAVPDSMTMVPGEVPRWVFRPVDRLDPIIAAIWYGEKGEPRMDRLDNLLAYRRMSVWGWLSYRTLKKRMLGPVFAAALGLLGALMLNSPVRVLPLLGLLCFVPLSLHILRSKVLLPHIGDIRLTGYDYQQMVAEFNQVMNRHYQLRTLLPFGIAYAAGLLATGLPPLLVVLISGFGLIFLLPLLLLYGHLCTVAYWQICSRTLHATTAGNIMALLALIAGQAFVVGGYMVTNLQSLAGLQGALSGAVWFFVMYAVIALFPMAPNPTRRDIVAGTWMDRKRLVRPTYVAKDDWPDC